MKELRIVCSALPSHENPELIELEDETGKSIEGEWEKRSDDLWHLIVIVDTLR
jgi:hypothetical protein